MKALARLYAIADASFGDPVRLAQSLFDGGARLIQVRNKNGSARDLHLQVEAILRVAPPDSTVIVNDRADVALTADAAGVHLGQNDLPCRAARSVLGPERIIGISTHNLEQALRADEEPADYIAVGPVFPTRSKANPEPVVGLQALERICSAVKRPVVAIGGITIENAKDVFACGAASVAVISDLLKSDNVAARTRDWLRYNQSGI